MDDRARHAFRGQFEEELDDLLQAHGIPEFFRSNEMVANNLARRITDFLVGYKHRLDMRRNLKSGFYPHRN